MKAKQTEHKITFRRGDEVAKGKPRRITGYDLIDIFRREPDMTANYLFLQGNIVSGVGEPNNSALSEQDLLRCDRYKTRT